MTDTQHLPVPEVLAIDANAVPPKKGHRHKRSFAISGDFDFLKQPGTVPPLPTSTPASPIIASYTHNQKVPANAVDEDQLSILETAPISPFKQLNQMSSPRFFISEEPKFSSPFQGVPDAIINLDDALKTKPKSFKNHKRSESAPPDLAILLNPKTITRATLMIEEEEDDDSRSNSDRSSSQDQKDVITPSLLSPLRPYSPTPAPGTQYANTPGSPVQSRNMGSNYNKFNSLKISGQKQRYHHYTKKLSINSSSATQPQSLKEKPSTSSLSSGVVRTPLSTGCTPSKQASTPSTPVSYSYNASEPMSSKQSCFERGPISPVRTHHSPAYSHRNDTYLGGNYNTSNNTTFKYETKIYDMPHGSTKAESMSSRDDRTLLKKEMSFHDDLGDETKVKNLEYDVEHSDQEEKDRALSNEILFGEPGDVVDLSRLPSPVKHQRENLDTLRKEDNNSSVQPVSVGEVIVPKYDDSPESRSVSDSVLISDKTRKKKVKSKLNFFFASFFNKSNNELGPHNKKL